MEKRRSKVSYVKKPMARRSFPSAVLSLTGLLFSMISLSLGIRSRGEAGLNAGAFGFCGLLLGLAGLLYGFRACREKEKNYILAKIAIAFGGIEVVFWLCMIMIGLKG